MSDLNRIFHSFGINDLINASSSGLMLFEIENARDEGVSYVCTVGNDSARRLSGREKLTGLQWQEFFGSQPEVTLVDLDQEVFFKESGIWCRASNMPVDENHFMCTLTDISPRKQVEDREEHISNILHEAEKTMQFGSWICEVGEVDSVAKEWSPGIYALMGYTPEEVSALTPSYELFFKHIHPDDQEKFQMVLDDANKSLKAYSVEYRILTRDGQEKHIVSRGHFVGGKAGKPVTTIGSSFDLTSIKKIQNELERKVEELNRSNFDLEQFAYVASHDLQEPLRKIVSFGERLENRGRGVLDEEMNLYLDRILNATRRMQDMISNLLEFSRFARSKEGFVKTDLNEILKTTLSDLEVSIQNKDAKLTVSSLPIIEAIPVQMSQLFNNLLSNSLKFTLEEKRPEIVINSEKLSPSDQIPYGLPSNRHYVRITIADNGIGFENNDSNRIFTLFQRLRGRSEYEGAGIGLSVCKKVVENHSGIIMASGEPQIGATFTLVLPVSQS